MAAVANSKADVKFTKMFINNEWHNAVSGKTFDTLNPATGDVIASVQEGDKADVGEAVRAARSAFALGSVWRTMDATKRSALLFKLAELVTRDVEDLAVLIALDVGKPISASRVEILGSVIELKYFAGFCDKASGKTVPIDGDFFAYTRLEPIGVVGIISPWNYPIYLLCAALAPALAAGNVLVVKPAEQSPLATLHFAALIKEAGFPAGVVNVVPGHGPTAGAAISEHPDIDQVSFTGSRQVGRIIQAASAMSNLKRVTLELGGKSPLVITQNCDLNMAVNIAQNSCFKNSGQVCCAATRIFVHESIHDAFVDASVREALKRKLGDPFLPDTVQGPQVDRDQLTTILELIASGVKQGATLKCGGKRHGTKGFYVEPTIFTDVKDDMRIAREEIFGPVMQIFKYKTLEEAIARSNDTEYGLAAGIITSNLEEAIKYAHSVRAGNVSVNNMSGSVSTLPFGGYKQSGNGRSHGEEGIREYMEVKTVSIKIAEKNS